MSRTRWQVTAYEWHTNDDAWAAPTMSVTELWAGNWAAYAAWVEGCSARSVKLGEYATMTGAMLRCEQWAAASVFVAFIARLGAACQRVQQPARSMLTGDVLPDDLGPDLEEHEIALRGEGFIP